MRTAGADTSAAHLLAWLGLVEERVRTVVAARRASDPAPDDPFRGLYLRDEHVELLLAGGPAEPLSSITLGREPWVAEVEAAADRAEADGELVRLRHLASAFALAPIEVVLLLVALAPDLDSRFERLYGYLNDDVSRRRASVGLCLELAGVGSSDGRARGKLRAGSPLVDAGLILVEESERPFLTRSLRVPDRVAAHLLGDDRVDPDLGELLVDVPPASAGDPLLVARALGAGARLVYLREGPGAAARSYAGAGLAAAGLGAIVLDLDRAGEHDMAELARSAAREARMRDAGLVAGPVESLLSKGAPQVRAFAELACPVVLTGHRSWDPTWSRQVAVVLKAPAVDEDTSSQLWGTSQPVDDGRDAVAFRLAPEQIERAAAVARLYAAVDGRPLDAEHLRRGARGENAAGLERLARRIEPAVGWDDLVLPPANLTHLRELSSRVRQREQVLEHWGMRPGGGRGRGIIALFAGESGTGKTMSAEVVAADLGLDLYTINLATVVDKYVGETEKNLERIFSEADQINGVLLFDEADALFGKRSEVRDAHDRYANIEVAYLLQRLESFDGLAILSTNLRANVDDAFARRLDSVVEFPMPAIEARRALWARCLGTRLPLAPDVELDFCARAFPLSGGNIRSIALTAAYMAADQGHSIGMLDLMRATYREYRKLGHLTLESEFGEWLPRLAG
ncbi:MAG: ATP-binding protein [Acidimicrobiales bacterium]